MEICPYLEETFKIIGESWNGLIINYLSRCIDYTAHFSDMKGGLKTITPCTLGIKFTELGEWELIDKKVTSIRPVSIVYELTDKGKTLAEALGPIEAWARDYVTLEHNDSVR